MALSKKQALEIMGDGWVGKFVKFSDRPGGYYEIGKRRKPGLVWWFNRSLSWESCLSDYAHDHNDNRIFEIIGSCACKRAEHTKGYKNILKP